MNKTQISFNIYIPLPATGKYTFAFACYWEIPGHGGGNFLVLLLRHACFRPSRCRPAHSCRPTKRVLPVQYSTYYLLFVVSIILFKKIRRTTTMCYTRRYSMDACVVFQDTHSKLK